MVHRINKWEQTVKLKQNRITSQNYPESELYSDEVLRDFLNRYPFVYVKLIYGSRGRGVMRIGENADGGYTINGYTASGSKIVKEFESLEELTKTTHSLYLKNSFSKYIVQQGISSFTSDGMALGIRVHVQYVQGKWVVGGMHGKIGNLDDGVVSRNHGARALPVQQLLVQHLQMDQQQVQKTETNIERLCLEAASIFHREHDWLLECGIDIGIDHEGKIWIFEVNMRPSIKFFYYLEDKSIAEQLVMNRKKLGRK